MQYLDFLKRFIETLGLTVKDGFIYNRDVQVTINGKPFVIPTKKICENLFEPDQSGAMVSRYEVFNPLNENLIKQDSAATKYLRKTIESTLNYKLILINLMLIESYRNNLKDVPKVVSDFHIFVENAKKGRVKLFDDNFMKIYKKVQDVVMEKRSCRFASVTFKKGIEYEKETYRRGFVVNSPFLDNYEDCGLGQLRAVDKALLKIVGTYAYEIVTDRKSVIAVSNNGISATFMVIVKGWLKLLTQINNLGKSLKVIDENVSKMIITDVKVTLNDLDFEKFSYEAKSLPSETEDGVVHEEADNTNTDQSQQQIQNDVQHEDRDKLLEEIFKSAQKSSTTDFKTQTNKVTSSPNVSNVKSQAMTYEKHRISPNAPQYTDPYGQPVVAQYGQPVNPYGVVDPYNTAIQPTAYGQPYVDPNAGYMQQPVYGAGYGQPEPTGYVSEKQKRSGVFGGGVATGQQVSMPTMDPRLMKQDPRSGLLIDEPAKLLYDPNRRIHIDPRSGQPVILNNRPPW